MKSYYRDCLPDQHKKLLLRVALGKQNEALAAWQEWKKLVTDINKLDSGSYKLFPLVYRNLKSLGLQDSLLAKLQSAYRYHWARNGVLFNEGRKILDLFEQRGVPALVLKGGALLSIYYKDLGARVMEDIDILIPEEKIKEAASILQEADWVTSVNLNSFSPRFGHAIAFYPAKRIAAIGLPGIDLHCHALMQACWSGADNIFWRDAVTFEFLGKKTKTLSATGHLFHILAHGLVWNREPSAKWVADAMVILRETGNKIDWRKFVAFAESTGLSENVTIALSYLIEEFGVDIPEDIMRRLRLISAPRLQRIRCRLETGDFHRDFFGNLALCWCIFSGGVGKVGLIRKAAFLPEYLRHISNTRSLLLSLISASFKIMALTGRALKSCFA